ncbi:MAG: hypothetical protein Kow0074_22990 [Candidatus Zixiibacteriota bacterium]
MLAVVLLTLVAVIGCSDDSPTTPTTTEPALRTIPDDGASNVDPADSIHIMFHEPVDSARFHLWFYCVDSASHDALVDSLHHGMMGMGHHHHDSAAFYDRMHNRMVDGDFHWFDGGDSCIFHPTSPLSGDTEYVLHFRHDMTTARGGHMYHMGQPLTSDLTVRFRTRP